MRENRDQSVRTNLEEPIGDSRRNDGHRHLDQHGAGVAESRQLVGDLEHVA
jgi:hypothetical protein